MNQSITTEYPKVKRNVLLNPGPSTTRDSVKYSLIVPDICPREKEFGDVMHKLRKDLLQLVHAKPEDYTTVLFCGSGTICLDSCINSLLDKDKVAFVINNGAYSQRAVDILKSYGMDYVEFKQPYETKPDLGAIENALKNHASDPSKKPIGYVYITHHETGTGLLNPIKEIGALAHRIGAFFVVDSTSSVAMLPINVYEQNVDFCMASAQKGLMSFSGLSFIIGRTEIVKASKNFPKRSYYTNLFMQYDYFEKTGQMHFTPPVQVIYATAQALKEYLDEGEMKKYQRHMDVMTEIHKGEEELGLIELIKREDQSGLVSCVKYPDDPNFSFEKIHDYCYERGFTIYPGKIEKKDTFRLCSLGAIYPEDIKNFWKCFREGLEIMKVKIPVIYKD